MANECVCIVEIYIIDSEAFNIKSFNNLLPPQWWFCFFLYLQLFSLYFFYLRFISLHTKWLFMDLKSNWMVDFSSNPNQIFTIIWYSLAGNIKTPDDVDKSANFLHGPWFPPPQKQKSPSLLLLLGSQVIRLTFRYIFLWIVWPPSISQGGHSACLLGCGDYFKTSSAHSPRRYHS